MLNTSPPAYRSMVRNMMAWMHYTTFAQIGGEVAYCNSLTVFDTHLRGSAANFMVWEEPASDPLNAWQQGWKNANHFLTEGREFAGWSYGLADTPIVLPPLSILHPVSYPGMVLDSATGKRLPEKHPAVTLLNRELLPGFIRIEHSVHPDTAASFFKSIGNALLHDTMSFAMIYHLDDAVLGTGVAFWDGYSWGLYLVATHPWYRNQGIGTAITQALIREAMQRKPTQISLQSSPEAESLYSGLGFRQQASTWAWIPT